MPLEIGQAEFVDTLRFLTNLRGKAILSLDEVVVPVILVGDSQVPGSRIPRQGEVVSCQQFSGAVVGQTSKVLVGPPEPDSILVADRVQYSPTGAAAVVVVHWKVFAAAFVGAPTQANSFYCERPVAGDNGGIITDSIQGVALVGNPGYSHTTAVPPDTQIHELPGFVIRFGEALLFECTTLNTGLQINFWGRLYRGAAPTA